MNPRLIGALLFAGVIFSVSAQAQNRTVFAANRSAFDYAYGVNPAVPALQVANGVTVTGSGTVTLLFGYTTASDGTVFNPISTTAPVTVGNGTNADTVTPTAVSCTTPQAVQTCQVTASFNHTHGVGELVTSGTVGLQEALNLQYSVNGGSVILSPAWVSYGGTTAMITAATYTAATVAPASVYIQDNRGSVGIAGLGNGFWTLQPSTLTSLATPATLTATTVVFTAAPVGTWPASAEFFCVTYVDILGGESPCSASYTQTPTVNFTLNITAPPASTGAVGWRAYGGITSSALAYLLPITSTSCVLTTLETVVPACAMGANGQWTAVDLTTTSLSPVALGVTATNNPVPQGHTTFAFQPSALPPAPFQTNYGPFGTGTIASATASAVTPLGTFVLPAGYQNYIGRTVRVTGKINLTAGASSTLGIFIGTTWAGGVTAGLPITVCNPVSGFVFATAASVVDFSCTMTTNAVGATAIGSIQPESWFLGNTAAGTGSTSPMAVEKSAVAIGSLGLFAQNQYTVYITPLVAADTSVQLMSLHIETLL